MHVRAVAKDKQGAGNIAGPLVFAVSGWPEHVTVFVGGDIRSDWL